MATLYISEYTEEGFNRNGLPVPSEPPIAEQTVAIGAEAKSSAFNAKTRYVRIQNDAICSILFGASPTATTSKKRLPADTIEYFSVQPGDKVSVISNT